MKKIADFILKFKVLLILLVIILTIVAITGFKYIKIDSDFAHGFSPDDPDVQLFTYTGEKFGANYIAIVGLKGKNILSYESLTRIKKLSDKFSEIKGVNNVTSIINIMDIKKTDDGIEVNDLYPMIPKSQEKLNKIKKYILSNDMFSGKIVSKDGTSTIIMVKLRDNADKELVAKEIYEIVDNIPGNEKIFYSGFPMIVDYTGKMIQKDMKTLVPITFLVIMLILFISFGSLRSVFLPLTVVVVSIIWVFGLMGYLGITVNILSNTLPVMLLATGTAYGIHFINKYNESLYEGFNKIDAIKNTYKTTGIPIILAGLTTFFGFFSMISASLTNVQSFGIFASIGIAFALSLTLILIPPVLSYLKPLKQKKTGGHAPLWLEKSLSKIASFVINHGKLILITTLIIIVVSAIFIPKVSTKANLLDYYPENSEPRQAEYFMEKEFGGSYTYMSVFKSIENSPMNNPLILKELFNLTKKLKVTPNSKNPQSIADIIAELNYKMNGVKGIPDTEEKVGNLWFFIDGKSSINQMITSNNNETLLQGFIDKMDVKYIAQVVEKLDAYLKQLPKNIYPLTRNKFNLLSDQEKNKIIEYELNKIKSIFNDDIKFINQNRNLNLTFPNDVFWSKVRSYLDNKNKLSDNLEQKTKKYIEEYISGDETEIEVPENKKTDLLKLVPLMIKGDEDNLKTALNKLFTNDDPDDISDFSSSLISLIANAEDQLKIKELLNSINWYSKLNDNDKAILIGDLWYINEDIWGIPSKIAGNMTFAKDIKPIKFSAFQTGTAYIMEKTRKQLLTSLGSSVGVAMFFVFILLAIQLKSIVGGLSSLTAIIFTLMVNFLIMAIAKIPLDTASILFGSIAVGIGIDYSIHFIDRLKEEVKSGKTEVEAFQKTMQTTGVGIVINTITVALGFMVLLFSQMGPLRNLGLLVSLTMFWSALGAITIYPAVVLGLKLKFLRK